MHAIFDLIITLTKLKLTADRWKSGLHVANWSEGTACTIWNRSCETILEKCSYNYVFTWNAARNTADNGLAHFELDS